MMPAGPSVNMVEECDSKKLVVGVEEIHKPMLIIREQLMKYGLIPANHDSHEDCISVPEICENLKIYVKQLIGQATVQIGHPIKDDEKVATMEIPYPIVEVQILIAPLVTQFPALLPYKSTLVVP